MIDFDDLQPKKSIDYKIIIVVIISLMFAYYVYTLLFGDRSFSRLVDLQNQYTTLQKHVKQMKKNNEILQKEYFELKELEGGQ